MPLLLEIVTPGAPGVLGGGRLGPWCPGIEGELGILPHHAPLVSLLGVGELRIRKGGQEEPFAIVGGFLQVRPDKVVVMAETADLASRDRPREGRSRRAARPSGRWEGYHEGADLGAARAALAAGAAPHPRRRTTPPRGPAHRARIAATQVAHG